MTKKVGQAVVWVWAVCLWHGGWATAAADPGDHPTESEQLTPWKVPFLFSVQLCKGLGARFCGSRSSLSCILDV